MSRYCRLAKSHYMHRGLSLKLLRSRAMALPTFYGYRAYSEVGDFLSEYAREPAIILAIPTANSGRIYNTCSVFAKTMAFQLMTGFLFLSDLYS